MNSLTNHGKATDQLPNHSCQNRSTYCIFAPKNIKCEDRHACNPSNGIDYSVWWLIVVMGYTVNWSRDPSSFAFGDEIMNEMLEG